MSICMSNKTSEYGDDSSRIKGLARVKKIEDALLSKPDLKNEWLAYQAWAEKKPLPADLINKHALLTTEYLRQTKSLFRQYNIDTIHAAYYLQQVRSAVDGLHKGEYRQK